MEVIEIGKTQLIFVLDKDDMSKYAISTSENSPSMRDGYSRLVNDLGIGNRFLSGVLVQIFDSKNGGCEMFVTKIPESIGIDGSTQSEKKYIYIFHSIDNMLNACKLLYSKNERGGIAFTDKSKKKYYLLLSNECRYMGEFNADRCHENALEYLLEHGSLICRDAIETLSVLA